MSENDTVSPDDLAASAAVLDRWFAAFNSHDVDELCELADPAVEVIPLRGAETVPPGARYHGREGLRSVLVAGFECSPHSPLDHADPRGSGSEASVDLEFVLDDGVGPPTIRTAGCKYRIADGHIRRIRAFEQSEPLEAQRDRSRADALSPGEREVLSMIAGGRTVTEIADELALSPFTVRTHVRNAKDKLQARTTAHAVAIALGEGVLDV